MTPTILQGLQFVSDADQASLWSQFKTRRLVMLPWTMGGPGESRSPGFTLGVDTAIEGCVNLGIGSDPKGYEHGFCAHSYQLLEPTMAPYYVAIDNGFLLVRNTLAILSQGGVPVVAQQGDLIATGDPAVVRRYASKGGAYSIWYARPSSLGELLGVSSMFQTAPDLFLGAVAGTSNSPYVQSLNAIFRTRGSFAPGVWTYNPADKVARAKILIAGPATYNITTAVDPGVIKGLAIGGGLAQAVPVVGNVAGIIAAAAAGFLNLFGSNDTWSDVGSCIAPARDIFLDSKEGVIAYCQKIQRDFAGRIQWPFDAQFVGTNPGQALLVSADANSEVLATADGNALRALVRPRGKYYLWMAPPATLARVFLKVTNLKPLAKPVLTPSKVGPLKLVSGGADVQRSASSYTVANHAVLYGVLALGATALVVWSLKQKSRRT